MKSRPTSSHRTTQRIRLVDGTPKPWGETEFSALERPQTPIRTSSHKVGTGFQARLEIAEGHYSCKRCGFHQCACKSGDYDARRPVATGEHAPRLQSVTLPAEGQAVTFVGKLSPEAIESLKQPGKIQEFVECPSCAAKPGAPTLCRECLDRRDGQPPDQQRVQVGDTLRGGSGSLLLVHEIETRSDLLVCWNKSKTWGAHANLDGTLRTPWVIVSRATQQSGRLENCTIEVAAQMLEAGRVVEHAYLTQYRLSGSAVQVLDRGSKQWEPWNIGFEQTVRHWKSTYRPSYKTGWTVLP